MFATLPQHAPSVCIANGGFTDSQIKQVEDERKKLEEDFLEAPVITYSSVLGQLSPTGEDLKISLYNYMVISVENGKSVITLPESA